MAATLVNRPGAGKKRSREAGNASSSAGGGSATGGRCRNYAIQVRALDPVDDTHPPPCNCQMAKCVLMQALEKEFDEKKNSTVQNINFDDYVATGWISLYHCVQPFLVILIVFLSMNCKGGKCSAQHQLEDLRINKEWHSQCTISALYCLKKMAFIGSVVPLPGFTNLYSFYLDVRCHHARSKPDFRTMIVSIEEEIREHEALGELLKIQKISS